ncbi:PREDICTED: rho GTPase-activating protein 27 [Condylura cristata]|uniref:rho GTPase-activating protein 27 n=1 Tax=Condylura cristata TaxID=143302 RepID=UPI000643D1F2|nr:PREDICTED: rho GTPase-activating protein 27 [Condylura cristata]
MAADVEGDVYVLVEHPFEYTGKDGRRVAIQPNERYRLLRRSTEHWWHVRREPDGRPFYLPAQYVRDDSDNLYEALQDVCDPREERPEQVDDPPGPKPEPEPVYANLERQPQPQPQPQPRATSPAAAAAAPGPVWQTLTDEGTGLPYYYNPDTGVTTWESPFEAAEGATSPATSRASVGSRESLSAEWDQYWDEESHRVFFYNTLTGETAWEDEQEHVPEDELEMQPRDRQRSSQDERPPTPETDYPELPASYPEEDYSPEGSVSEPDPSSPSAPPPGWSCYVDADGRTIYTNHYTQEQWVRLEDHGKPYFYNRSDATVQWELPQVPVPAPRSFRKTSRESEMPAQASPPEEKNKTLDKAGVLHRTKTVDKGKRLRKKHWSTSWTVLEGGVLTFFKDSKSLVAAGLRQPSKLSTPEYTVDLRGALLTWAPKDKSSKKNVLELRSRDGSEYLIQHDSEGIISTWHKAITQGIQELSADMPPEEEIERICMNSGSRERLGSWQDKEDDLRYSAAALALGAGGLESDLSKVRHRLRKLLLRRPTLQSLREKGYIRDQVFGCPLEELCERERSRVPRFVQQCIRTVEARGLDIDGLYRISGNLATIQKLRHRADHDERLDLDDGRWEDVHVITGALKLFFRELPEPLFPFSHFPQFMAAIKLQDQAQRIRCVRDLVRSLPAPNHDTLRLLFQHLCRVIEHGEENRMSVQSVAIVFGPTLLRPETEETSMPMTMVFQNQVVELILQQCADIFQPH